MFPKKRSSFGKIFHFEGGTLSPFFSFNDRFRCLMLNVSFPLFTHIHSHTDGGTQQPRRGPPAQQELELFIYALTQGDEPHREKSRVQYHSDGW